MLGALLALTLAFEPTFPLQVGEPSPRTGILVDELRFAHCLDAEVSITDLNIRVQIRDKTIADLIQENAVLSEGNAGWWAKHGFVVGLVVGAVAMGAVMGGTYYLIREVK